jgi:tetratricopeptide (TPR) repeat protein
VPIDRDAALKRAEKLLRQGKLDGATQEYVRLIEDQPGDMTSINTLGDLYLRAGDVDQAVAQFTRIADHLLADGMLPKAAGLYKKALKAKPDDEHTLRQLAEVAARQGLTADAKAYLRQVADLRRRHGDERGAAESILRLGTLDGVDADARIAAAKAAQELGDIRQASALLRTAADDLETQGRGPEALDLLLSLARMELASAEENHARATLTRVLTLEPGRRSDVITIALELVREGRVETAFECLDLVTDAALLEDDWIRAVDGLQIFVLAVPYLPALIKLVELCVDAGLDEPLREAQVLLADAYLQEGRAAEARVISEDILDRDPLNEEHARRLVRALELLGVADARRVVEERVRSRTAPEEVFEGFDLAPGVVSRNFETAVPDARDPITQVTGRVEVDLSDALASIGPSPPKFPPPAETADPYERGLEHVKAGRMIEAIPALEEASCDPRTQFQAAVELGRLYIGLGELQAGVEWLDRAAEKAPATPEEGFALLYDLADALDRLGQTARALALLIELDADSGGYRDVRARIEYLARTQAGSHGR